MLLTDWHACRNILDGKERFIKPNTVCGKILSKSFNGYTVYVSSANMNKDANLIKIKKSIALTKLWRNNRRTCAFETWKLFYIRLMNLKSGILVHWDVLKLKDYAWDKKKSFTMGPRRPRSSSLCGGDRMLFWTRPRQPRLVRGGRVQRIIIITTGPFVIQF